MHAFANRVTLCAAKVAVDGHACIWRGNGTHALVHVFSGDRKSTGGWNSLSASHIAGAAATATALLLNPWVFCDSTNANKHQCPPSAGPKKDSLNPPTEVQARALACSPRSCFLSNLIKEPDGPCSAEIQRASFCSDVMRFGTAVCSNGDRVARSCNKGALFWTPVRAYNHKCAVVLAMKTLVFLLTAGGLGDDQREPSWPAGGQRDCEEVKQAAFGVKAENRAAQRPCLSVTSVVGY